MDFYEVLRRDKQKEYWQMFEEEVKKNPRDPISSSFRAFDRFQQKYNHNLDYEEHILLLGQEEDHPTECSKCGDVQLQVIYGGFPMKYCTNQDCSNLSGFWSWIGYLYWNGVLFPYAGNYFVGLYNWLTNDYEIE